MLMIDLDTKFSDTYHNIISINIESLKKSKSTVNIINLLRTIDTCSKFQFKQIFKNQTKYPIDSFFNNNNNNNNNTIILVN